MIGCRAGTLLILRWSRTRRWAPGPRRTPRSSSSPSAHSRLHSRNIRMPIYALFKLSWSGRFLFQLVNYCLMFIDFFTIVPSLVQKRWKWVCSRISMQCFGSGFILICKLYRTVLPIHSILYGDCDSDENAGQIQTFARPDKTSILLP